MALTATQRSHALLGRGYFPKELPPPFQTHLFAEKASALRTQWAALRSAMNSNARAKHPLPSHPILFDMARKGHARRTLAIPNPVNQFYLVEEISRYWSEITAVIDNSGLSITKCEIADEGRAVPMPPLSSLGERRIVLYAAQGAILQTDVLSFYHSIYTHAVPWALHGKTVAKSNRSARDPAVFGNRIDELLRSCQDGQTIGIPVGPDTSRVISELMLAAVEAKLQAGLMNSVAGGYRYIDDFFLCFSSFSDAEMVLAGLREACLYFDLQLNAAKTRTIPALAFNEETWASEISALPIASVGKGQRRSLMRFFSNSIELAKALPDESIASYAVRRTSKVHIEKDNWDLYEAFLIRMARENSNCIDSVVKIICTYAAIGYPISNSVNLFIERVVSDHAPYNQHFEVVWALWLARSLGIRLSPNASSLVFRIENDVCAVLALHLRGRRLLSGGKALSSWLGSVSASDLRGDHWLLIYEAAIRGGWSVPGAAAAVADDRFFSSLQAQGVSFFNGRAQNRALSLPRISWELNRALAGRRRALLPGAIMAVRTNPFHRGDFEELGGDYGDEDGYYGSFDDDDGLDIEP